MTTLNRSRADTRGFAAGETGFTRGSASAIRHPFSFKPAGVIPIWSANRSTTAPTEAEHPGCSILTAQRTHTAMVNHRHGSPDHAAA